MPATVCIMGGRRRISAERAAFSEGVRARLRTFLDRVGGAGVPGGGRGREERRDRRSWDLRWLRRVVRRVVRAGSVGEDGEMVERRRSSSV